MFHFQKSDIKNPHIKPNLRVNLKMKMILLIGILIIGIIAVIGVFMNYFMSDTIETDMGDRALNVAESVARIPALAEAFEHEDPASIINPIVAPILEATDAEFIVVGNTDEIRYAHPEDDQIGRRMVGGDNERALVHGESYVSKATGSLGSSLRAKVPVYLDERIVGVVSVGFLTHDVQTIIRNYNSQFWLMLFFVAGGAIFGAIFISSYIKKVLYGMEPEEIAHLLFQKETILQSTHEGIIALNEKGSIMMMNTAAQQFLFEKEISADHYIGKRIQELSPHNQLQTLLHNRDGQADKEMVIGNHIVFVNTVPIYFEHTYIGTVSTLRSKTEIELLSKELKHVKQYANALRAQTHEFSNKLYTILGLLQLEEKEQVIDFIQKERSIQNKWIHSLIQQVTDPLVSSLLLGKLNQANELGITLSIVPDSILASHLSDKQREALLTVLGNLIDNAIDAVQIKHPSKQQISIFFTDIGNDIIFEIEDSGDGILEAHAHKLFDQGFTLKEGIDRGFGLALSKQMLVEINGDIYVEEGELGGACFVVSIPKNSPEGGPEDA